MSFPWQCVLDVSPFFPSFVWKSIQITNVVSSMISIGIVDWKRKWVFFLVYAHTCWWFSLKGIDCQIFYSVVHEFSEWLWINKAKQKSSIQLSTQLKAKWEWARVHFYFGNYHLCISIEMRWIKRTILGWSIFNFNDTPLSMLECFKWARHQIRVNNKMGCTYRCTNDILYKVVLYCNRYYDIIIILCHVCDRDTGANR